MANVWLALDVEIRPGNETAACYAMLGLWAMLDKMPRTQWPQFLRGDCVFGNERDMNDAEERDLKYLFKFRQTCGVKTPYRTVVHGQAKKVMEGCNGQPLFLSAFAQLRDS